MPFPVDLSKLSDVVKNDVIKKDIYIYIYIYIYNAKIKSIEDKIPNITNLATNASLNVKINDVKDEMGNITNLATNVFLNARIN